MSFKGRGRPSQETIERVELPTNVKCILCNKNQLHLRYSKNQLRRYQESIYFQGALNAERPNCLKCSGQPSMELTCSDCGDSKSLDSFSKNARSKDRDRALCWDCQQKVSDVEPKFEDQIVEEDIVEKYKSQGASAFSNMSRTGSSIPTGSKNSSARSDAGTDDSGRVPILQPLSPGRATASRGRTQSNSNEKSCLRSGSQDTMATTSSIQHWVDIGSDRSDRAPRANEKMGGTSRGNAANRWYKQGAPKKTDEEKAHAVIQRYEKQQAQVNQQRPRDDDDDDDDGEEDYEM